jgi:predicted ATPase/transcriptional regulator with XRE-family HTH domain
VDEAPSFGVLLRRYRLAATLSQEALAERARLSVSAVTALERGRRTAPRPDTVALLAEALSLSPHDRAALVAAALAARAPDGGVPDLPVPSSASTLDPHVEISASPLPDPPTSLIGREHEAAEVAHLLRREGGSRLITLSGPGGVGKTRLALAAAAAVRGVFRDGVVFVDLSPVRDPALVPTAICQALGLREVAAQRPQGMIVARLQAAEMLLVLDNLEQVAAAAPLVADLLAACRDLVVLATSRVPLRLRAERNVRVRPLDTLSAGSASWEDIARTAAVRLFVTRALAVQPDFRLGPDSTVAVAEICRRLDGLPLAIELAAARSSLLPPAALLTRLERRLPVLKAGARDMPSRQQTMRAAIEWSYMLLSPPEATLFRRLCVFVGGCTLAAAEAVAGQGGDADGDILAGVAALVDHSMLSTATQVDGEPRFRILETIREYGLEQLAAGGEEAETRQGHASYFRDLVEMAQPHLFGPDQLHWLGLLERDHDNLREALAWARAQRRADLGLRLVASLWRFWYIRCHLNEGRDRLQAFLDASTSVEVPPAVREGALIGLAVISYAQTEYDPAARAAEESVALVRSLDDLPKLAVPLNILAGVARYRSDFRRAATLGEECVAMTRSLGDRWALALSLSNLAEVLRFQGAYGRARDLCDESLILARSLSDRWGVAQALLVGGRIALDLGEVVEAATLFEESLPIVRELDHPRDVAMARTGLGHVARARGVYAEAADLFEESAALLRPMGDKLRLADVLAALGRVRHLQGDDPAARQLFSECLTLYRAMGNRLGTAESLEGMAAAATPTEHQGAPHAASWLAVAATQRQEIASPLPPADQVAYERTVADLRTLLGEAGFAAAWAAGTALSVDEAVRQAQLWAASSQ